MTVFSPSANGDMARLTWRKRVRHICLAHAPGERIHHSILKELARAELVRGSTIAILCRNDDVSAWSNFATSVGCRLAAIVQIEDLQHVSFTDVSAIVCDQVSDAHLADAFARFIRLHALDRGRFVCLSAPCNDSTSVATALAVFKEELSAERFRPERLPTEPDALRRRALLLRAVGGKHLRMVTSTMPSPSPTLRESTLLVPPRKPVGVLSIQAWQKLFTEAAGALVTASVNARVRVVVVAPGLLYVHTYLKAIGCSVAETADEFVAGERFILLASPCSKDLDVAVRAASRLVFHSNDDALYARAADQLGRAAEQGEEAHAVRLRPHGAQLLSASPHIAFGRFFQGEDATWVESKKSSAWLRHAGAKVYASVCTRWIQNSKELGCEEALAWNEWYADGEGLPLAELAPYLKAHPDGTVHAHLRQPGDAERVGIAVMCAKTQTLLQTKRCTRHLRLQSEFMCQPLCLRAIFYVNGTCVARGRAHVVTPSALQPYLLAQPARSKRLLPVLGSATRPSRPAEPKRAVDLAADPEGYFSRDNRMATLDSEPELLEVVDVKCRPSTLPLVTCKFQGHSGVVIEVELPAVALLLNGRYRPLISKHIEPYMQPTG